MLTKTQRQNNVKVGESKTNGGVLVRDEKGVFVKGHPPLENAGRPEGSKDWNTYWKEAVKKYAELKGETLEEAEQALFVTGFEQARKGNYAFYKDTMDRRWGNTEPAPQDVTIIKEQKNIYLVVEEAERKLREELEK